MCSAQPDSTLGGITATHDRLAVVGYTVRDRAAQLHHGTATEVHTIPGAPALTITAAESAMILVVIEDLFGTRTASSPPPGIPSAARGRKSLTGGWLAGTTRRPQTHGLRISSAHFSTRDSMAHLRSMTTMKLSRANLNSISTNTSISTKRGSYVQHPERGLQRSRLRAFVYSIFADVLHVITALTVIVMVLTVLVKLWTKITAYRPGPAHCEHDTPSNVP